MAKRTEKTTQVVRSFRVDYYDSDDRVHIHMAEQTQVRSGRGREWQQEDRNYHHDFLVLTPEEFQQILAEGVNALIFQVDFARRAGLRTNDGTEQPYTIKPIELREEESR